MKYHRMQFEIEDMNWTLCGRKLTADEMHELKLPSSVRVHVKFNGYTSTLDFFARARQSLEMQMSNLLGNDKDDYAYEGTLDTGWWSFKVGNKLKMKEKPSKLIDFKGYRWQFDCISCLTTEPPGKPYVMLSPLLFSDQYL